MNRAKNLCGTISIGDQKCPRPIGLKQKMKYLKSSLQEEPLLIIELNINQLRD